MSMMIDRAVRRTVLGLAVLAVMAFGYNHETQPCSSAQVGAGGMCVTVQVGGAA